MRFDAAKIALVPWKNGGGTTRELALRQDAKGLVWRLSLADIAQDGAFSPFDGLRRIHTIIEGQGLILHGADQQLAARPLQPLSFDGGLDLTARLTCGPCRAVNLIYDPARVAVSAEVCGGAFELAAGDLVLVLSGNLRLGGEDLSAGQGRVIAASTRCVVTGKALVFRVTDAPADR